MAKLHVKTHVTALAPKEILPCGEPRPGYGEIAAVDTSPPNVALAAMICAWPRWGGKGRNGRARPIELPLDEIVEREGEGVDQSCSTSVNRLAARSR